MTPSSTRLFDFIDQQLETHPLEVSVTGKVGGTWNGYSTSGLIDKSYQLANALLDAGIRPDDKVAIISTTNRPEFNVVDLAVLRIGAVDVPIYPTITRPEFNYILQDCGAKMVFVSDRELYEDIQSLRTNLPNIKAVYIFDEEEGCDNWETLVEKGSTSKERVKELSDKVNSEQLATLIYTSGTTGTPKGVMLSHKNIASNVLASADRLPIGPGSKSLSFLPLCHIYERMLGYLYVHKCSQIYYAESLETIGDDMKEVNPDIFTAVPRLLEKVYEKIVGKGSELTGVKKKLFFWALELAEDFDVYGKNGWWYGVKLGVARKLIFSKWQEALGGNVKLVASGSAALSPRLCRIYNAAGIPVMEGYGLTETSPVCSVNEMKNKGFRFGTTGRAIEDVQIKIAEDGEILIKGPNVMMGYYNKPEKTAEVIDEDGWFHTGDIGKLEDGEYLKITDRKKEIFKTSGGKYIAPQVMENSFKQSRFIEQIIVIGENQKHPSALVVPSFEFLKSYCEEKGMDYISDESICTNEQIISRVMEEVDKYNQEYSKYERVKKIVLLPKAFTIDGGELTPTMKLKRRVVCEKYASEIDGIYC